MKVMKNCQLALMVLVGAILLSACYNGINEEQSTIITNDDNLPLVIRPFINKPDTRVSNNQFELSDKIGVFLFENKEEEKVHINNIPFEYTKGNIFISEQEAYYPKDKKEHLVYAYYPYQKENNIEDRSSINIEIHDNQSNIREFHRSDFLYAVNEEVKSSKRALQLKFNHQLAQVSILLKVSAPYTSEDLRNINPKIKLINIPTQAKLDLHTGNFDNYTLFKDVTPHTNWETEGNLVKGCKAIILPIETFDKQKIQIEAEGILYECDFPINASFHPNTINKITINYVPSKGIEVAEVESNIGGWTDGEDINMDMRPILDAISINSFEFNESNIIYLENSQGDKRAIACKELLTIEESEFVATTLYPIIDGETQWTEGIILAVEENKYEHLLSATVNNQPNKLIVTPNQIPPIRYIFTNKEGEICFSEPQESEFTTLRDGVIIDQRKSEVKKYPMVKIGGQLWMKANLDTQYSLDGNKLAHEKDKEVINAGYATFSEVPNEKLYNTPLMESEQSICPKGWHIPTSNEVKQLFSYVSNEVYLTDAQIDKYNYANLSGLSLKIGVAYSSGFDFTTTSTAFWVKDDAKRLFNIRIDRKEKPVLKPVKPEERKMISIRCMRNL